MELPDSLGLQRFLSQGRLSAALHALDWKPTAGSAGRQVERRALAAELMLDVGDQGQALEVAAGVMSSGAAPALTRARMHRVRARAFFYAGDLDLSAHELKAARRLCAEQKSDVDSARLELTRFALFLGVDPLEASFAELPSLRRLVARAAVPHLTVELRLCVARAEARRSSTSNARHHLDVANGLLEAFPNFWLQGLLLLDLSNIYGLDGDIDPDPIRWTD